METNKRRNKVITISLAITFILVFIIYAAWSNAIAFGDELIREDHMVRANFVFEVVKIFDPNNSKVHTRLKITKALLGYGNVIDSGLTRTNSHEQDIYTDSTGVSVPILLYHYIRNDPNSNDIFGLEMSVPPELFDKQMNYLTSSNFHILTLDELRTAALGNKPLPAKSAVITIDDGYEDLYSFAYPILKKYNIHATAFIITDFVGGPNYLTWSEIKEMDASGLVSFESHTLDHTPLTTLDDNQIKSELTDSKSQIENQLQKPVEWLAYPYGIFNTRVENVASESGYFGAVGIYHDAEDPTYGMFTIPRIIIKGSDTLDIFVKEANPGSS